MAIFSKKKSADKPAPAPAAPVKSSETAYIGAKLNVTGKIGGSGNLIVLGRFEGEFELAGEIVIAPSARVRAEVKAAAVTVGGHLDGNVIAADKIHIEKGAEVGGRMKTKKISIAEGAVFNGEIEMEMPAASRAEPGGPKEKTEGPGSKDKKTRT